MSAATTSTRHNRAMARARTPAPHPKSKGWRKRRPLARWSRASRQPWVVSCRPLPKARPASTSKAMAPPLSSRRAALLSWAPWTMKRPARTGGRAWYDAVTQSRSGTWLSRNAGAGKSKLAAARASRVSRPSWSTGSGNSIWMDQGPPGAVSKLEQARTSSPTASSKAGTDRAGTNTTACHKLAPLIRAARNCR